MNRVEFVGLVPLGFVGLHLHSAMQVHHFGDDAITTAGEMYKLTEDGEELLRVDVVLMAVDTDES